MSARKDMLGLHLSGKVEDDHRAPLQDEVSIPEQDGAALRARLAKLPPHLREAARRSWDIREEDYRFLADR
ncbi:MAG: hypothetical protein U0841_17410 [Chloroflexia bacterium]